MSLADILKLFGSDQPAAAACPIHAARKPKVESPKDSPAPQGPTPTDFTTVFNLNQLEQSRSEFSMRWFSAGKQGKEKLLKLLIAAKYDYNIPFLASKLTNSNTSKVPESNVKTSTDLYSAKLHHTHFGRVVCQGHTWQVTTGVGKLQLAYGVETRPHLFSNIDWPFFQSLATCLVLQP